MELQVIRLKELSEERILSWANVAAKLKYAKDQHSGLTLNHKEVMALIEMLQILNGSVKDLKDEQGKSSSK